MKKVMLVAGVLLVFIAGNLLAQEGSPKLMGMLTAEQKKQWSDIRYEFAKVRIDVQAKLKAAQLDLRQLMQENKIPNVAEVDKKLAEISRLQSQLKKNRVHQMLKMRKLLTDEQWEKWQEVRCKIGLRSRLHKRDKCHRSCGSLHHGCEHQQGCGHPCK